jgi:hypothetical protein
MKQVDSCSYCESPNFYWIPQLSEFRCEDCGEFFTGNEDDDDDEIDEDV